ncbi:nose resistant to fluoxetine protein 6 [Rhipicephalus sanguineus]|uniref:nose resistant to fluoxetine protein 6 n=1 Tax=Rhipicephalus sanguineus TaxID=34632 RepID=UPI0020C55FFD|nr:nose resistant to fluoxetine protein 6 [Rhipicephalus sanguineus]
MFLRKGYRASVSPAVVLAVATSLCGVQMSRCLAVNEDGVTTDKAVPIPQKNFMDQLREMVANAFDSSWSAASRRLVQAEVSPTCSAGLLNMARGMRNLEPWAFRLFDASGKYPNGLLQATTSDPGAFDECIETVLHDPVSGHETLRAQYCNLRLRLTKDPELTRELVSSFRIGHPRLAEFKDYFTDEMLSGVRIGICVLNDCNETELQALVNTVKPPGMNIEINNCVTSLPVPLSSGQKGIIAFLTILGTIIVAATIGDLYLARKKREKDNAGILTTYLIAFSAAANSGLITRKTNSKSDAYALRFLHGIRFLSLIWIMLGHSYGTISDTLSGLANNVAYFERWENMIVTGGYLSVDTFFFLSGFLMCYTVAKQRANGWIIFFLAVIRRFIRSTTPLFFMIMCMYMLPALTSGPDAKTFFNKFYYEINNHWWDLLLQVRNFRGEITFSVMPHVWYLSADFQLFVVSLLVVLILKNRHRWILGVFIFLSILGCSLATWQVAGTHMNPFMVAMTETVPMLEDTLDNYYVMPFYHAVAYFSGCITYFLMINYKEQRLSKVLQVIAWCLSLASGLCCLFMKIGWYQQRNPTTETGKLFAAFFDRILWSLCVSWVTFACSTARGGK